MSNLAVFNSSEFGSVRFVEVNGKPYAVASDAAKILGYTNISKAIKDHCKGVTKRYILTSRGNQLVNLIPEGDIYRLIIRSKLKTAERFEQWVFDEVIPSIRQNGVYSVQQSNQSIPQLPQTFQEALRLLADQIDENQKLLPKAKKYDHFMSAEGLQTVGEVAKALKLGRNRLFSFLKSKGYLMSDNTPYQKFITLGYFDVSERVAFVRGRLVTNVQTLVKPKGVDLISDLLGINQLETMEDISNFIRSRVREGI